jgi:hypothetical protein
MQVKVSQATRMIATAIKAKITPMIHGSPGIGKSQIVYQIAETYNLKVIDLRLSQCDPTDLAGFPQIDLARQKAGYVPMDTFPLEGESPPPGYSGWILFLDEANSAPKAVQAAAYKIILDRAVGQKALHQHCAIVAAGNLETDGAIVEEMSTALQSRMIHFELISCPIEWRDWASEHLKNHQIPDFIKFKPGSLMTFAPDHTDRTYACPRTWEFGDRLITAEGLDSPDILPLLAGTISEGVAREFLAFCKIYKTLLTVEQIEANPDTVKVPTELSVTWALTGSISQNMTASNASALMKFVSRLDVEFQVITLREVVRKHKPLRTHPAVTNWIAKSAVSLF